MARDCEFRGGTREEGGGVVSSIGRATLMLYSEHFLLIILKDSDDKFSSDALNLKEYIKREITHQWRCICCKLR